MSTCIQDRQQLCQTPSLYSFDRSVVRSIRLRRMLAEGQTQQWPEQLGCRRPMNLCIFGVLIKPGLKSREDLGTKSMLGFQPTQKSVDRRPTWKAPMESSIEIDVP